jgi:hypothetical protein
MRLLHWLARWIASHSEADKLARVAQRHAIEQQTSGRVWPFEG